MSSMMLQYAVGSEGILHTTNLIKHSPQELQQKNDLGPSKSLWENERSVHVISTDIGLINYVVDT